ncbi:hypothetical protein PL8927_830034 [Planktothrix serta PCC 8927]|uniref:Uncharacterized protein n=1 Tax=Planktothrix serta PCC 8927 TaxID=671068 RepID=A0A7Z9E348_9CYAN|nr:hypothetical protein [Planktothrix serta]VXD24630.1 hypothetical protein PL8927_830034 [Planktothrix serta PCC 8927]
MISNYLPKPALYSQAIALKRGRVPRPALMISNYLPKPALYSQAIALKRGRV